jgi:primosomal protein N' (replication factor Y)
MNYVEVLVASATYHGQEALTYASPELLQAGTIVAVPLRTVEVLGIVRQQVQKPPFKVKSLVRALPVRPLSPHSLSLIAWMQNYYPAPLGVIVQQWLPKKLLDKYITRWAPPTYQDVSALLPQLTQEQHEALAMVEPTGIHLLHGETGTGKTRVYIELAKQALAQGHSSIILTPEIGLTSQLADDFRAAFGERVIVMHSQLTDVERQKAWIAVNQSDEPRIVIGARSALFSPLKKIGLIVVDEAHETAYKQDQAPHYHASRVASKLGALHRAIVVLGSATPLVTDYFLAEHKKRPIIRMQRLARGEHPLPAEVTVVDLKDHQQFPRTPYISATLVRAIEQTLAQGEQVLLFLNRRGTARVIFCEQCGWQATCPHCDLPLVYHGDDHSMRCHTCSHRQHAIASCPSCNNPSIIFKSIGTKALAEITTALFPSAKIQRFDTDNRRSERIEEHFEAVRSGKIDIIIGTQTLAKGLDLPHLGLVGVIIADTSLSIPDYNAEERTYQLLSQVLGRVGRGHRASRAVVQTYNPKSQILKAVLTKDWQHFYENELHERAHFLFPPFCYVLKTACRRATLKATIAATERFAEELRHTGLKIRVEGPAPSFHEKVQNKYQWQLIIKSKQRDTLLDVIAMLPSGWTYDIDPMNLL